MEEDGVEVEIFAGRRGSFEITRGDVTLFSKLGSGRFPEDSEYAEMIAG